MKINMPSMRQPPTGSIPPPVVKDVKESNPSSELEVEPQKTVEVSAEDPAPTPASKDLEVDESDLEALEEQKKVPYQRFKEKVDETKSLKDRISVMERERDQIAQRAAEDAELRVKARLERERESAQLEELDPTERQIRTQSGQVDRLSRELEALRFDAESQKTQAMIERLERKYPKADSLAVLGWMKAQGRKPSTDIAEELMAESHNRTIEGAKVAVREILEHKKAKAKAAVPTREGGIRLKDSERPKSLKEAKALMDRFYGTSRGS